MIKLKRLCVFLAALGLLFTTAVSRAADEYPNRPIRLIVGFAPGGGNDLIARVLAKHLTETFGKTVLVDNRPGAAGMIGTEIVAQAPADGNTLILSDTAHLINRFVFPNARYDPIKDFAPVSLVGTAPMVLVVHPKAQFQSVSEFIAQAKNQPAKMAMGSGGVGTITHLTGELFQFRTGIKLNHVPYKGAGPALGDIVAGQIQCMFSVVAAAAPLVSAGRIRALAVSSARRFPAIPDVPTFEEAGVADFRVTNWYGIFAPVETPRPVVSRLNKELAAAVQAPAVKEQLERLLVEPGASAPEEFLKFLKSEASRWSQLIKTAGIKAE